ncbi:MAG: hypothetical protein WDM79_15320, partial [Terricaulis sp.]
MGSSGSGRITDYPGTSKSGGDGGPDGPPEDRCAQAFQATLEDVGQSDYFKTHGALPSVKTQLEVVHAKRLVVRTATGESVGNLPTSYNYLAGCIKAGWSYVGLVLTTTSGPPEPTIIASFVPTRP